MAAFFGLRLYADYTGVRQPHVLEGALLSVGICALTIALVFGIAEVRQAAPPRSLFTLAFAIGGGLLAIGTFLTVYLAGR